MSDIAKFRSINTHIISKEYINDVGKSPSEAVLNKRLKKYEI